jgi:hypothetical protein
VTEAILPKPHSEREATCGKFAGSLKAWIRLTTEDRI